MFYNALKWILKDSFWPELDRRTKVESEMSLYQAICYGEIPLYAITNVSINNGFRFFRTDLQAAVVKEGLVEAFF